MNLHISCLWFYLMIDHHVHSIRIMAGDHHIYHIIQPFQFEGSSVVTRSYATREADCEGPTSVECMDRVASTNTFPFAINSSFS